MELEETSMDGLFLIHRNLVSDQRGVFSRLFAEDELEKVGRPTRAFHVNTSTSPNKGTIRGLHFQYPPYSETKIICCTSGRLWDVAVDLRPGSKTRFQYLGASLSPDEPTSFLVPEGFAHGFITLEPNTTILYIVSNNYAPAHESGIRFDDPLLSIEWPVAPTLVSKKDLSWPGLETQITEIDRKFNLIEDWVTKI
jgi:dTDP-4-dehydrorhamnose 3,5-epimerase